MRWLDGITDWMDMNVSKLWQLVMDRESLAYCSPWGRKGSDMNERLNSIKLIYQHSMAVVAQLVKKSACSAGDLGSIPGLGRSPGEGNGNPLQYPCLENLMDRAAWWAAVHEVTKSWAQLSN